MTIGEIVRQGFYYARTCRWLWLFGFFVGITSSGSSGGGNGSGTSVGVGGVSVSGGFPSLSISETLLIAGGLVLVLAVVTVLRFVGEGALIEGVVRARQGRTMTTREGFRTGWAHWGVLLRIALIYFFASTGSVVLLAAPCVIAMQTVGPLAGVLLGLPAFVIAVPWLVTLYLVQAFAWRIAVLENRSALDAIGKARLFLHGRLMHGLKLILASLVGTLGIVLLAILVMTPVALLFIALIRVLGVFPVIVLPALMLLPAIYVVSAMVGIFRSSVWTIGYLTQVES